MQVLLLQSMSCLTVLPAFLRHLPSSSDFEVKLAEIWAKMGLFPLHGQLGPVSKREICQSIELYREAFFTLSLVGICLPLAFVQLGTGVTQKFTYKTGTNK
jgi:hypothetical protein